MNTQFWSAETCWRILREAQKDRGRMAFPPGIQGSDIDKLLKLMRTEPPKGARFVVETDAGMKVIPYCPVEFP